MTAKQRVIVSCAVSLCILAVGNALGKGQSVFQCDFESATLPLEVDPYSAGASLTDSAQHSGRRSLACTGNGRRYQYFGRGTSVFHPYWTGGGRVRWGNGALRVSTYEHPNAVLDVVVNVTDKPLADTLTVDTAKLKPVATVYDPLTRQSKRVSLNPEGRLPVEVRPYMMLLVEVGGRRG